jgi:hypothetical protein
MSSKQYAVKETIMRVGKMAVAVLVLLLCVVVSGCAKAAAAPVVPVAPQAVDMTSSDLAYGAGQIEFQVDVNGQAAVLLLGQALDAIVEIAHQ